VWFTVFIMACVTSTEPFRLAMTVVMLGRPRPVLTLLSFLAGGFITGMSVGVVVLFGLRSVITQSQDLVLPILEIGLGIVAWLIAAFLVVRRPAVQDPEAQAARPPNNAPKRFTSLRSYLNGHSPIIAGLTGISIALPSVDYLAALAVILASGAAWTTQVGALLMFNLIAFAFVELPLVGYLFAPQRTRLAMTALNDWIAAHRRLTVAGGLAIVGTILIITGSKAL
jgi:hypothetical protein